MLFRDRIDAGEQLAQALAAWRGRRPIVYAIPRGAVPMGKVIGDALGGELDVVLTRKLGAPGNPEFAIGAVDETGWSYVAEYAASAGADKAYIDATVAAAKLDLEEALSTLATYRITPRIEHALAFARERQVLLLRHDPTGTPSFASTAKARASRTPVSNRLESIQDPRLRKWTRQSRAVPWTAW